MIARSDVNDRHEPTGLPHNTPRTPGGGRISDEALIAAIARGDQQAMRRLYERHSGHVYRFARRLGVDQPAAEDLVSEVFLDVWRSADAFEGRARVSTWLLAITRNSACDIKRRRTLEPLDELAFATIEDETDGPELAIQRKQAALVLFETVQDLSPAHRNIIDLVYYREKSIHEVARLLNIPTSTVKTRMFHARKRLAQLLTQRGQMRPGGMRGHKPASGHIRAHDPGPLFEV
jgi:RNA polymerase sigma-70 factor, ECF subfamily